MVFDKFKKGDMPEPPHRAIDGIFDKLRSTFRGLGDSIMSVGDKGPLGTDGPHRSVDNVLDGVNSAVGDVGNGVVQALNKPINLVEKGPPEGGPKLP